MIRDLDDLPEGSTELDRPGAVVVVGAGAAGLALVTALEAAGREVVLVESGGDPRDQAAIDGAASLNSGAVTGQGYQGLDQGRSRVLGGATQLWHGQCTRMRDSDLARRAWVPHSGWPLALADLDPWYRAAERWFGLSGRGYDRSRWAEHRTLSPLPWSQERLMDDFAEYTSQPHLGDRFRSHLQKSDRVTVLVHATVAAVLTSAGQVTGVELRDRSGRRRVLSAGTVVLAAGAIENARILMLSDPAGVGLGTGREWTGRYLQDHPIIDLLEVVPADPAWLQDRTSHLYRGRSRIWPKVRIAPGAQEREGLVAANALVVHDYDDPALDAVRRLASAVKRRRRPQDTVGDLRLALTAVRPTARTAWRRWVRGLSSGRPASEVRLQVWLEQVPDPDSRVTLDTATDRFGMRRARVDWRISDTEIQTSRTMAGWVAQDLEAAGIATTRALPAMEDDTAWRASVTDAFHPAGTTRMSVEPEEGVVDPDLAVHGVQGLHVSGASVFPIAGYANPTLTIVALSLRLADHLIQDNPGA